MTKERPKLGFEDELDGFDPAEWNAEEPARPRLDPEIAGRAAEVAGFRRREPVLNQPPYSHPVDERAGQGRPRRRRTGRNAQLNLKARPETIDSYIAIADANGWGLGETLEHAVVLLQREHAAVQAEDA